MPRDLLKSIADRADLSNGLELRNVCPYVLCFAGFLRFDDVIRIKRHEISFHSGYMFIKVKKSKNGQLRQGDGVLIAEGEDATCPVKILKEYFSMFDIDPLSNEFIFRHLMKTKESHKLGSNNGPLVMVLLGITWANPCGVLYPIRRSTALTRFGRGRGGWSSAGTNSGVSVRVFQRHGHWKSATAKDGYVKDSTDVKLSVSRSLGL